MVQSTTVLEATDGTPIPVTTWTGSVAVRATIHIVHGMAEYGARYARLATHLADAGVVVWAHDQRGHGAHPGRRLHLGDRMGWARAVDDVLAVNAALRTTHPRHPTFLLGHSMGSSVARHAAGSRDLHIDGLVLSGVSADPGILGALGRMIAASEARLRGPQARSRLMSNLTFGRFNRSVNDPRTRLDWLSRDRSEVDAYIADPLCGGVATTAFYRDLLDIVRAVNRETTAARIRGDLPVLVMSGARDPVGDMGRGGPAVADQLRRVGVRDVTLKVYPEARHEVFNEVNRDDVTADLLAWLQVHAAAGRSR